MVLDGVGLAFGAFGLVWSTATILRVQPSYEKMLSDSDSEIAAFTRRCLTPAFELALGSGPLLVVAEESSGRRASADVRSGWRWPSFSRSWHRASS